jgi:hypothetical protein
MKESKKIDSSRQETRVAPYEEGLFRPLINANRISRLRPPEYSQKEVNTRMPAKMRNIFDKQIYALNRSLELAKERNEGEVDDPLSIHYYRERPHDRIIYSKHKPGRR